MANNLFIDFLPPWIETGIQPAFYDKESGTVLQQTARMYAKVNETVAGVDHLNDVVDDYIERFNDLHDYVDDYFDNLDVQEEINNKLDAMVADGSFQPLLDIVFTQYFNILKNYTDEELSNKVDKDGVGQVTYNNLSQSVKEMFTGGNTAVVGENSVADPNIMDNSISYQKLNTNGKNGVAGFNQLRTLNLTWEQGTRHTDNEGALTPSDNTIVNETPFKVTNGMRIKPQSGYKINMYSYTSGSRYSLWSGWSTNEYMIGTGFPSTHVDDYFYISVRKSDDSDLLPSEGIDALIITENQTNVKPSYSSLDVDTQNLILGNNATIKLNDSYSLGNALQNGISGASYYNGVPGGNTSRAFLNTPIYLPVGTTLKTTGDWRFVVLRASSYPTETKDFYPKGLGYVDDYTVTVDDVYYICFKDVNDSGLASIADQFINNLSISLPVKSSGVKTAYVSGIGNDSTGDGTYSNPYRQITKALTVGATTIMCEGGYKYNNLSLSRLSNIRIVGIEPTYSTSNKTQAKPYFDNSIILTGNTLDDGCIKIPYVAEENSDMYDCLVTKTKDLKDNLSTRSEGYYCTIFSNGDKDTSHRYIPVLTRDTVAGHFYYDGSYIYLNPYSDNDVDNEYSLIDVQLTSTYPLIEVANCNNVTLENLCLKHTSKQLFYGNKSTDVKIINCDFCGSSQSDNMAVRDTNVELVNCISYLARNDGFNFHGFGASVVTKCIGCNCFDDGASHHDQCNHTVIGGEYYNNGKGGISSPTYGCSSDINGCYIHNNNYGVHTGSNSTYGMSYLNLNNCLITKNKVGVNLSYVSGVAFNNKIVNNDTNIVNNSSVVVY